MEARRDKVAITTSFLRFWEGRLSYCILIKGLMNITAGRQLITFGSDARKSRFQNRPSQNRKKLVVIEPLRWTTPAFPPPNGHPTFQAVHIAKVKAVVELLMAQTHLKRERGHPMARKRGYRVPCLSGGSDMLYGAG